MERATDAGDGTLTGDYAGRYSTDGGSTWTAIASQSATTYTIASAQAATTYRIEVWAFGQGAAHTRGAPASVTLGTTADYDIDDDGLLEISNLAQLNAIRYDLNGDGAVTDDTSTTGTNEFTEYAAAFPDRLPDMGCPTAGCTGYELTADLDFDTGMAGDRTDDDYHNGGAGWQPIGVFIDDVDAANDAAFTATFEGNGHTISNLFISRRGEDYVGLFGHASFADVRNLGLENVDVTGGNNVGGLAGWNEAGSISASYVTGSVTGVNNVGGLAGRNNGSITTSYSAAAVTGTGDNAGGAGGLQRRVRQHPGLLLHGRGIRQQQCGRLRGLKLGRHRDELLDRRRERHGQRGGRLHRLGEGYGRRLRRGGQLRRQLLRHRRLRRYQGRGRLADRPGRVRHRNRPAAIAHGLRHGNGHLRRLERGRGRRPHRRRPVGLRRELQLPGAAKHRRQAAGPRPCRRPGRRAHLRKQRGGVLDRARGRRRRHAVRQLRGPLQGRQRLHLDRLQCHGRDDLHHNVPAGRHLLPDRSLGHRAGSGAHQGAPASVTLGTTTDYDTDDDGLLEISNLAQLNAIRYDPDGDGVVTDDTSTTGTNEFAEYAAAFPNRLPGMGCPDTGCTGYELTADLDFDENRDGSITSADAAYWNAGAGWQPIAGFTAVFEGNGHTISNLFISRSGDEDVGLFGSPGSGAVVRGLGLTGVSVTGGERTGALVGANSGEIRFSYAVGSVNGSNDAGGLAGSNAAGGVIAGSYAAVAVSGSSNVGGLVGDNAGNITAVYATGSVTGANGVGGLVGRHAGAGSPPASPPEA